MSVLSGISAVVNGQHTVRKWSISSSADIQTIFASNTKGGPVVLDGNKDWSGSFEAYGFQPVLSPGESFEFLGSVDGTSGVISEADGAIVDSIVISADIEAGTPISYVVNFSGNGTLTTDATAVADETIPCPLSAIGAYLTLTDVAGILEPVPLTDVRTFSITLTAANQSYVSSDTEGYTKRLAGNFSATVSVSLYESDFDEVIQPNSCYILSIIASDETYWDFSWIVFNEAAGFDVDREGAALIGYSLGGAFTGYRRFEAENFFVATLGAAMATWEVGDVVRNKTGGGDDWSGEIYTVTDTTHMIILITDGTYAVIDIADDIENITHASNTTFTKAVGVAACVEGEIVMPDLTILWP